MHSSIEGLKQAQPYIRLYKDNVFVIKIGGGVLDNEKSIKSVAKQLALLFDLGIKVVLVHGGGTQANRLSEKLGIKVEKIAGRRITSKKVLDVALMTFSGKLNSELVASLTNLGVSAVGLSGADSRLITASKRPPMEITDDDGISQIIDFGQVGDIKSVDTKLLDTLFDKGFMPVVSSICGSRNGKLYNVNADSVAEAIAKKIEAKKLIFITEVDGLLSDKDDNNSLIPFADQTDLKNLLKSNVIAAGMRPKVQACINSTIGGVQRSHIINGHTEDSLLIELFTGEGCGTMIVSKREKQKYQDEELD